VTALFIALSILIIVFCEVKDFNKVDTWLHQQCSRFRSARLQRRIKRLMQRERHGFRH